MKILHVLAQLPSRTGSGVYFSNMVDEFKKYKHQQRAIFATQDEFKWNLLGEEDQYPVEFKTEEIPFPIVGMSDVMPYDNTLYVDMDKTMMEKWESAFRKRLERAKEEFNPDIIFAHHLWILTSIVQEVFPDTKIIGVCHNTDLRQARMNPEIKDEYVNRISELDYIFSASEEQKNQIGEIYGVDITKIIAVAGGFNQDVFYFPEEKTYGDKIRLVFCGKIDPSKGIYELIEVFKDLDLEDISLDIIGNPGKANKDKIERAIEGEESIKLYNLKDQVALGDELRKKDIFVMPSFYEGLGLISIESLACGLYVVATEIEALMTLLGEEIEDSGIIKYVPLPRIYDTDKPVEEDLPVFKEDLKKSLLVQIEKIRKKKDKPREMKEQISNFSWEGLVARMNNIIEKV